MMLSGVLLAHSDDFCYDDERCDPYAWGDNYPSCHPLLESHHSPINLNHQLTKNGSLDSLNLEGFNLTPKGHWRLVNQGYSIVLEVGDGMQVSGGGLPGIYRTVQLHFHWGSVFTSGSEHTLDHLRFPMEVSSLHNENFHPISSALSFVAYKGQTKPIPPFPLINLLPQNNLAQYYRYHGSLTTPPCSQVVLWTVYEVPIYISWSQFDRFISGIYSTQEDENDQALLHDNYRHIHPTYSRTVYASKDARRLTNRASCLTLFHLLNVLQLFGLLNL
ncbi:Carbonic anhydrase 12 [Triplophysa tibetana]|uniref:Carbonic anhydrase 12 n=1 Tax=Triplophysa tibetana TaxID=1572043 RepID=A0A5A9N5T6_9TELE|nr:Carbonic anhydrase 12 [Triplophysa tibetana]